MKNGEIVDLLRRNVMEVKLETAPAVCISGGIDSTVVLHHVISDLMRGDGSRVFTFTALFCEGDERDKARKISDYYGTRHVEVTVTRDKMIETYHLALQYYPFPRFNLWGWVIAESVRNYGLADMFIGEGCDEIFGYKDRGFLKGWSDHLEWVWPSWEGGCRYYGVNLHAPFRELQDNESVPITDYYLPPEKHYLRKYYEDVLPDFAVRQEKNSPAGNFYAMMGMTKEEIQIEVARTWLKVRNS